MNNNNRGFGEDTRFELRKRRKMNRILNTAIGIVAALVLFFGGTLFFGGNEQVAEQDSPDPADDVATEEEADENLNEDTMEENEVEEHAVPEEADTVAYEEEENDEAIEENEEAREEEEEEADSDGDDAADEREEEEAREDSDEEGSENDGPQIPENEGDWEPIGTEQSGSFTHNFSSGSQNWNEMEMAMEYATGISRDDMTIWRLENGGNATTAVGTVGLYEERHQPYRVTIEFIEGEGWKPVNVEVLDGNPYTN
ncbi:YrrS family protein [Thalassorhabdus alkalitolerans]|uniref:YrrS family protein n=1 Tax=Thalassorhabdus alkalitolerans TaxID=2282697 RepID=A0ABW0YSF8_9BACI